MESLCLRKACIPAHLNVCSLLQKTMSVLKISALLVTYALFVCQMYCTNAAPARPAVESSQDDATLTDYEARRLLNAIIKEFVQMTTEDLDQAETEENSITAQKRACNTATCVTHRLADFLSRSGGTGKFVPTNVGSRAFGRRRRLIEE
ncbi:calcitonin/calcitonin-related polypeptide, alpha isoform X1 [Electrophorus electricus]|uniref:calcitonin/calcitonin-related polypeptide, alpha isoform X1 n=1 Tax=Electrophorus electricus TaxID=8005 RepID=UPI000F0A8951|nr:calcitonin/calcitonin-related polypeptide, alpha isoform X1 [Electrophorus electricus]XP_026863242.1 calcitonin/calcitonin-related polypeptide, alpha isoform X1 [Electrophorus electricus]